MFGLIRTTIIAVVLAFNAGSILAQTSQKGFAAYQSMALGDYATALQQWQPFAEQGYASSQYALGGMYSKGWGVLQNYAETMKWYRLAAEQGYATSQYTLGVKYKYGKGVLQDYAEAMKWLRLAAEQGYALAQSALGGMYSNGNGQGVLQDNVMAHMWYNIAAANGSEISGKWRDETASKMTSADISKAQSMARECMSSNYKNCGW